MDFKDKKIKFKKAVSDYRYTGRITQCFFHDKSQCNGEIKQSHSIQRNGRLSIIEGDVNGNQMIYTFTEYEVSETHLIDHLKPIGKASASTFYGFCDLHDTKLFSPIEQNEFDESDKHCFLHSYRSFAHSYHKKIEQLKAYKTDSQFTELVSADTLSQIIEGAEIGVVEGENDKQILDELLDNQEYDGLEYLIHVIPEKFPIACSSSISPYYTYRNEPMNNHIDHSIPFSHPMLTVLPDHDQTIIILAAFQNDKKSIKFIDELSSLYPLPFYKAISSILISCAENTFFAPALWNALGKGLQRQLCDELELSISFSYTPTNFNHSKINFFDRKYSAKTLALK